MLYLSKFREVKMKKAILKSFVFVGMAIMIALSLVFTFGAFQTSVLNAAEGEMPIAALDTSLITVKAYNHDNAILPTLDIANDIQLKNGSSAVDNWKSETYAWKDIRNFKITLNTDALTDAEFYNYKYTLSWTPELIKEVPDPDTDQTRKVASFDTNHTVTVDLLTGTVSTKDEIVKELYFTIDSNTIPGENVYIGSSTLGEKYTKRGGMGLYIFSYQDPVTGAKQSQIFQLKPDSVESLSKPIISVKAISSKGSVKDAFLFSIDASYKFVNREQIYWSVTGTGKDGRSYVLTPEEITNPNTTNAIFPHESVERTGQSFTFDPGIEGTWIAECLIRNEDLNPTNIRVKSPKVSTVKGLSTQSIIWIVVGAAAAAGIAVAVVIVISIKKEKVY